MLLALTLTLSPKERGQLLHALVFPAICPTTPVAGLKLGRCRILPLLGGE
jgi:hypothetical protein